MKILIYGINYFPELTGIGKYSGEMSGWFAANGHQVRVVTAPPYYPDWRVGEGYSSWKFRREQIAGVDVMRCPLYVPSNPSTIKRLLHLFSFAFSSGLRLLTQLFWSPDVIVCVVPSQFCSPATLLFSILCGARRVIHIQDYELDAMFGLGMAGKSDGSLLTRFAFTLERWLLRRFHVVSTISPSMLTKAKFKGVDIDKLILFPNWSEVQRFREEERDPALLGSLGVNPDNKIVLYSGNIGEKQGLEVVLEAAREVSEHGGITFLIVGEGGGKSRLQAKAAELSLSNVAFAPLLPYEDLPRLLASADCHLVVQRRGVADAVLPSKLTNILAAGGNAVITADPDTTLGKLCQEFPGIAQCVEPESASALVEGIQRVLEMPRPNKVAKEYARNFLDKDAILTQFVSDISR
jgi:colanic acid biosynthesis glycosyl transferase WcaI